MLPDGEQGKPSFATYPLAGLASLAPDGVVIPFADGHTRQSPRLTAGPFRYATHADEYLREAKALTDLLVKQAVIAASAISLIHPPDGIDGYSREPSPPTPSTRPRRTSAAASTPVPTACSWTSPRAGCR